MYTMVYRITVIITVSGLAANRSSISIVVKQLSYQLKQTLSRLLIHFLLGILNTIVKNNNNNNVVQ